MKVQVFHQLVHSLSPSRDLTLPVASYGKLATFFRWKIVKSEPFSENSKKQAIVSKRLCWEHEFFHIVKMAGKKFTAMTNWGTTCDQNNNRIKRLFYNIGIIRKNFSTVRKLRGLESKAVGYFLVYLCTSKSFQTRRKRSRFFVVATGKSLVGRHLFYLFQSGEAHRKVWGIFNDR